MHLTTSNGKQSWHTKKVKRKHDRHAHLELLIEGNIYVRINIHAHTHTSERMNMQPKASSRLHVITFKAAPQRKNIEQKEGKMVVDR